MEQSKALGYPSGNKSILGGKMAQGTVQPRHVLMLLLLFVIPITAFGQEPSAPAPKWRQSQKKDTIRGIDYTQFTLAGKFLKWPEKDASNRPTLEVDCEIDKRSSGSKGKFWRAFFLAGTPLTTEYIEPNEITAGISYYQKIPVRYRLDSGPEKNEQWSPGLDKNSASIPKGVFKRMLEAHTVVTGVNENNAEEVSAQFEMPDSAEIAQACSVAFHRK
jgi:hypothetical protein